MRVKHLPALPQWHQGSEHWVLQKLPSWLRLPTWTVAHAAAIINDEDPESQSADTLELLDDRSISRFTTNEKEKYYLQVFSRNKEAFMVHANAHKKVEASPAGWLQFAEEIVGISPEWKQLAIANRLWPSTPGTEAQPVPVKAKAKGGRPKTIDKKANAVRKIIEAFEKAAKRKFESDSLPGSAADLLNTCKQMEKAQTKKNSLFGGTTTNTFNTWLHAAGYSFSPGRTPDVKGQYWTQLCVKTIGLITSDVFTGVYSKDSS